MPETPLPLRIDPNIYNGDAGRYRCPFLFGLIHLGPSFKIRRETDQLGDHLVGYITGKHIDTHIPGLAGRYYGCEIFPESETALAAAWFDLRLTLGRNKAGKANSVTIQLNGSTIRAARVAGKPATDA